MSTINVVLTASDLCDIINGVFTYEACEAICKYIEENNAAREVYHIGDIVASFSEIPADYVDEYDEQYIVARLKNGNVLMLE